jgi:TfoX/Sxy family transcriptional regulator of competence genes
MASDPDFVTFVCEQLQRAGRVTTRKMFGEYALYIDGQVFAFICRNEVFIKPTDAGRAWLGEERTEGQVYPGSKMYFTAGAHVEDADWMTELVRITLRNLPPPTARLRKAPAKQTAKKAPAGKATGKASGAKAPGGKAAAKKSAPGKAVVKKAAAEKAASARKIPAKTKAAANKMPAKRPASRLKRGT